MYDSRKIGACPGQSRFWCMPSQNFILFYYSSHKNILFNIVLSFIVRAIFAYTNFLKHTPNPDQFAYTNMGLDELLMYAQFCILQIENMHTPEMKKNIQ